MFKSKTKKKMIEIIQEKRTELKEKSNIKEIYTKNIKGSLMTG